MLISKAILIVVIIFFLVPTRLPAQSVDNIQVDTLQPPRGANLIHIELGGNAGYFSINYDRNISNYFSVRIGYASWPVDQSGRLVVNLIDGAPSLILMAHYIFDEQVEFGIGQNIHLRNSVKYLYSESILIPLRIAYRYKPHGGGFSFAFAVTPFIECKPVSIFVGFGLSFGHSF